MVLLEVVDLSGVVFVFYLIGHSPAFIMLLLGFFLRKNKPKAAKVLFILAAVYFLIGFGICGSLLSIY